MMEVKEVALVCWLKRGSLSQGSREIPGKSRSFPESPTFLILLCYQYVLQRVNFSPTSQKQPLSAPAVAAAMKLYLQEGSDLFLLALRLSGTFSLAVLWFQWEFSVK